MGASPTAVRADFALDGDLKATVVKDADADSTVEKDVMSSPCRVTHIKVKNDGTGTPTAVYLKLFDDLDPTLGTTAPDYDFKIPANVEFGIPINGGEGIPFANGLSFACIKEAGTAATTQTDPDTTVEVYLTCLPGVS